MTVAQLAAYPAWTGVQNLPGYSYVPPAGSTQATKNGVYQDFTTWSTYNQHTFGNIRNPYVTDFIMGARKSFAIEKGVRFELGMDVFNVFNHPQFGSIDVNPAHIGTTFGELGGGPPSSWVEPTSGPNSPSKEAGGLGPATSQAKAANDCQVSADSIPNR